MARNPTWVRDELILALDLYFKHGRKYVDKNHPDLIALSQLLNTLPIHPQDVREASFRNPAGVAMKIGNLMAFDPDQTTGLAAGGQGDRAVWEEFAYRPHELHAVADAIRIGAKELPPEPEEFEDEGFSEGRVLERIHKRRERSRTLVAKKLTMVKTTTGKLRCEVCEFDFEDIYGPLGAGFAECHHVRPLSDMGETTTRLSDLAVVCSNCHRMLHRSKPLLNIEELRNLISQRQNTNNQYCSRLTDGETEA